jgi:hypothetical protein
MAPKYVIVPHRAHSFIVNMQPSSRTIDIFVRVEHIGCIVLAACGFAVAVKHPMKLVAHQLYKFPGPRIGSRDF